MSNADDEGQISLPGFRLPKNQFSQDKDPAHLMALEKRFERYWSSVDFMWSAEKIERSVIGVANELMTRARDLTPHEVQAMHAGGNLMLRLLNKYKPDLKAIEMSGSFGMTHEEALSALESRAIAAAGDAGRLPNLRGDIAEDSDEIRKH